MRFSTLSSVLAVVHGVGASLSRVSAKDALKQGSASRTLASYQKYTDELVNAYLRTHQPTEGAALDAIKVILDFFKEMHKAHVLKHEEDELVGPHCTVQMELCTKHLNDEAMGTMDTLNSSEYEYRQKHKECRDAQAHGCATSHSGYGWASHLEPNTCDQYDAYRESLAAKLPDCAKKSKSAYAMSTRKIQADEVTNADTLNIMENCLEDMQKWLIDGLAKNTESDFAEQLYPGPPGLYPRMEICEGGKQCCEDAAFCEPYVSEDPAAQQKFCNMEQLKFEEAHCQYEVFRHTSCNFFKTCRDDADSDCAGDCAKVAVSVAGRKADNETMERIMCLLTVLMDTEEADKPASLEKCKGEDYFHQNKSISYFEMVKFWDIDGCPPGSNGIVIPGDAHCRAEEELTCASPFKDREYYSTWHPDIIETCTLCQPQLARM